MDNFWSISSKCLNFAPITVYLQQPWQVYSTHVRGFTELIKFGTKNTHIGQFKSKNELQLIFFSKL